MPDTAPIRADLDKLVFDLRAMADEIRVQLHLASKDAAVAWTEELEPKLTHLEHAAAQTSQQAADAVAKLGADLKKTFTDFRGRLQS